MADADQDSFPGRPDVLDPLVLPVELHLLVNAVGGAAESEFAERDQVAFAEKILDGRGGLFRQVHFAFLHALEQVVGRQVDELDLVGAIEQKIRHGLAYVDARDLGDHVVQALEMLHVYGGVDGDARAEQLVDVLPAFLVAGAGGIRMGKFINEDDRGFAATGRVEIELLQDGCRDTRRSVRGRISSPSRSASVSFRPWVSTRPTTISTPSRFFWRAASSMA